MRIAPPGTLRRCVRSRFRSADSGLRHPGAAMSGFDQPGDSLRLSHGRDAACYAASVGPNLPNLPNRPDRGRTAPGSLHGSFPRQTDAFSSNDRTGGGVLQVVPADVRTGRSAVGAHGQRRSNHPKRERPRVGLSCRRPAARAEIASPPHGIPNPPAEPAGCGARDATPRRRNSPARIRV